MRILLAGATGAIGSRLVPLLIDAGHEGVGTTRSPPGIYSIAEQSGYLDTEKARRELAFDANFRLRNRSAAK